MSTRAVYTFSDNVDSFHVYKHHDGYPSGAADSIVKALGNAWELPRFEPDEFAAAFIAANKAGPGSMRLTSHWANHGDLEYRYEITCDAGIIKVACFKRAGFEVQCGLSLADFVAWAK